MIAHRPKRRALLICEGPCNPDIASLDAAIRSVRRSLFIYGIDTIPVGEPWVAKLRALDYTLHHLTSATEAQCLRCQTKRRYGAVSYSLTA